MAMNNQRDMLIAALRDGAQPSPAVNPFAGAPQPANPIQVADYVMQDGSYNPYPEPEQWAEVQGWSNKPSTPEAYEQAKTRIDENNAAGYRDATQGGISRSLTGNAALRKGRHAHLREASGGAVKQGMNPNSLPY